MHIVYYLNHEECFVSVGANPSDGGVEVFYENKLGGTNTLARENIIDEAAMLAAAKEFFLTRRRPTCLAWDKL